MISLAIEACIKAGEAIMEVYAEEVQVEYKDDTSPLTLADKISNEIIMGYLIGSEIPIISEENKQIPYIIRKDWISCWIVDPLDGTKEFIKKNGEFTVNIALVTQGMPEFGVVYAPASRTLYFGDVNLGKSYRVYINRTNTDIDNIIKNATEIKSTSNNEFLRVVGSKSHMNNETIEFINNLKSNSNREIEIISKGSSLKFCLVAEGTAEVYPRFAPTMEWDTAAGHAICKAVGLSVINTTTQKEIEYNKEHFLNPYFLVMR